MLRPLGAEPVLNLSVSGMKALHVRVDYHRLRKRPYKKTEHRMPGPVYVQDPWLAPGLGGFLPEHERWLQEFLCGTMRPLLVRIMHSLRKRNGGNNPRDGPHPQDRVGVLNLPPIPLVPGGPVKWGYRGLNYGDFLWDRAVNQKRIPPLLFTLGGFTLLCTTAKAAHRRKKQFARVYRACAEPFCCRSKSLGSLQDCVEFSLSVSAGYKNFPVA
ncbi:uncharacterized protein LOC128352553 [Hemicordylus capensis]|uniref:uncharacterized protein LOC128348692 n=1 Tax=Hemicordylus capensis TaxID=884348 RepID=UPI0023024268|nr:uncharacterized protein LOC128348692 [Hemicordylus capensis]XP_053163799.1 uncharacterized protein LOC128350117 [Hemicordylus capensis]XP_053163800.1 uncharacterized protein LOC128350118 [Hemicordylus capensis]XP_053169225.1 uncharacterized protein LOC128352553 [Hemicordylus capensis]